MITAQIRRRAARLLAPGLEETTDQVVTALRAPSGSAHPADLERICAYAVAQVPYYQRLGVSGFDEMPVMNKALMRDHEEDFMASDLDRKSLTSRTTSGSTGTPFRAFLDPGKVARHRAQLVGSYRFTGVDPFGWFVHARAWGKVPVATRARYALQGQRLYAGERDAETIASVGEWIRRHRGVALMGYSSYLEDLMRGLEESGYSVPPGTVGAVLGAAEPASSYLAKGARKLFGLTPHMRYSNMELGVMAITDTDPDRYKIDTSSFHVEILAEDSDTPAGPGELGRVVITDLYNRAMPFIRYDTGDLARFDVDAQQNPVPNVLAELQGRRLDVLVAGTPQAPRRASALLLDDEEVLDAGLIRQFQLVQTGVGRFTWVLNAEPGDGMEAQLRKVLDKWVGDIVAVDFVYTDEIPAMNSGKRKLFVNRIPDLEALLSSADS